jgi:hypothetical protein
MTKRVWMLCPGSQTRPAQTERRQFGISGRCGHCHRWVRLTKGRQLLASHAPTPPKVKA